MSIRKLSFPKIRLDHIELSCMINSFQSWFDRFCNSCHREDICLMLHSNTDHPDMYLSRHLCCKSRNEAPKQSLLSQVGMKNMNYLKTLNKVCILHRMTSICCLISGQNNRQDIPANISSRCQDCKESTQHHLRFCIQYSFNWSQDTHCTFHNNICIRNQLDLRTDLRRKLLCID